MQGCDWRERKWRKSNQPEVHTDWKNYHSGLHFTTNLMNAKQKIFTTRHGCKFLLLAALIPQNRHFHQKIHIHKQIFYEWKKKNLIEGWKVLYALPSANNIFKHLMKKQIPTCTLNFHKVPTSTPGIGPKWFGGTTLHTLCLPTQAIPCNYVKSTLQNSD